MNFKALALIGLALVFASEAALAHSPIEGIGNFYNGLLHPILVPAHLLLIVALGVFLGQQDASVIQTAIAVFAVATVAGLTAAWFSIAYETEAMVLALAAAVGLLIALSPKLSLLWCVVVALSAGLLLGIDSQQAELSGQDRLVALFGSGLAIYLLVLYPMSLADNLKKKEWQRIGIRVLGSWVAASSLLVLTLSFSAPAQV